MESSTNLTYITIAKSRTGARNGSSETFILHWQKQDSEYDKLVNTADKFSNTIDRSTLENVVDGLTELMNDKSTTVRLHVTTDTILSYDGHVSLLYGAA